MAAPTSGAKSLTTSVTMGATPTGEDPSVLRVMELLPHLSKPFVLVSTYLPLYERSFSYIAVSIHMCVCVSL